MQTIKIKDVEYQMPQNWGEVNLSQFQKIQEIIGDDKKTTMKSTLEIIACLLKIDKKTAGKISVEESNGIDIRFISTDFEKKMESEMEIGGIVYYAIKDFKKLSLGEYADLDYYVSENIMGNIHFIAAIIMRPPNELEEYDGDSMLIRAEIFKEKMNVVQLISIVSFFLNSANGLFQATKESL
jgi:hypothetical protein